MKNFQIEDEKAKQRIKTLENVVEGYKEEEEAKSRKLQSLLKDVFKPSQVLAGVK